MRAMASNGYCINSPYQCFMCRVNASSNASSLSQIPNKYPQSIPELKPLLSAAGIVNDAEVIVVTVGIVMVLLLLLLLLLLLFFFVVVVVAVVALVVVVLAVEHSFTVAAVARHPKSIFATQLRARSEGSGTDLIFEPRTWV